MSESKITLDNIVKGKQERPIRQVVYGLEGVGKTQYVCSADGVIVLDFEGGMGEMDAQSFPLHDKSVTFNDATEALRLNYSNHKKLGIKTVGIDSLDWLEKKIHEHVCKTNKVDSIELI